MDHRVMLHGVGERRQLIVGRQLALDEEPCHLEEGALVGELLDGIPAIPQDAFLAVNEGDGALARAGVAEARIERDRAGLVAQLRDVDADLAFRSRDHGQVESFAFVLEVDDVRGERGGHNESPGGVQRRTERSCGTLTLEEQTVCQVGQARSGNDSGVRAPTRPRRDRPGRGISRRSARDRARRPRDPRPSLLLLRYSVDAALRSPDRTE